MTRRAAIILTLLALLGCARIAATWRVFNETVDEPIHLAAGFEWLTTRGYSLDAEHPPLARIVFALPPVLAGAHVPDTNAPRAEQGLQLFHRNGNWRSNLAASRAANLIFFLIALTMVVIWPSKAWKLAFRA